MKFWDQMSIKTYRKYFSYSSFKVMVTQNISPNPMAIDMNCVIGRSFVTLSFCRISKNTI